LIKISLHLVLQKIYKYKFFNLLIKYLKILIFTFALDSQEKKIYKSWLKSKIIKKNKHKGYLIYNPTIPFFWGGFHFQQIFFLKIFQELGYTPIIINGDHLQKFYSNLGFVSLPHIYYFLPKKYDLVKIRKIIKKIDFNRIINFKYNNIPSGRYAYNSTLRHLKVSTLDHKNKKHQFYLRFYLLKSITISKCLEKLTKKYNIITGLFNDHEMCGEGELFSKLIKEKQPLFSITAGFKNNTFYLKKYYKRNLNVHPRSCSKLTINEMKKKSISKRIINDTKKIVLNSYSNKSWEIFANTQTMTKKHSMSEIKKLLNINNNNLNIVIFSHVYYDATFSWGKNIFKNYEEWLVETINILSRVKNINCILKVHPANLSKDKGYTISKEVSSIKNKMGRIPEKLIIIPADSKINTISIIQLLDYCITVRGTVGIESALFGKKVITCGTGRYDNLGFTFDFVNKKEYFFFLKNIANANIRIDKKINTGCKFAYYSLLKRPFFPNTKVSKYSLNNNNYPVPFFHLSKYQTKNYNKDFSLVKKWVLSKNEDFLN
jgi:hypothetical protein